MTAVPAFLAPPAWTNADAVLYHGTIDVHARSIRRGIQVRRGNPNTDFGRGFYTTTSRRQARSWAWQLSIDYNAKLPPGRPSASAVVIRFLVPRDRLARLQSLSFVRGDYHAVDFWSFVHHCRSGGDHRRLVPPNRGPWYDMVAGPVAAVWRTRLLISDADQFSFHTGRAATLLDASWSRAERVRNP